MANKTKIIKQHFDLLSLASVQDGLDQSTSLDKNSDSIYRPWISWCSVVLTKFEDDDYYYSVRTRQSRSNALPLRLIWIDIFRRRSLGSGFGCSGCWTTASETQTYP